MTQLDKTPQCDICGKFIGLKDLIEGKASIKLISVDSEYTSEEYETLCKKHNTTEETE